MKLVKTIVTVTPLAVEADSRTFKQASSVARFGYRSVVVENGKSRFQAVTLPFELRGLRNSTTDHTGRQALGGNQPARPGGNSWWTTFRKLIGSLVKRSPYPVQIPLRALSFTVSFTRLWFISLRRLPKGSIYYLHGFTLFPAVFLLCKRYDAKFIYDAHDFYPSIDEDEDQSRFKKMWTDRVFRRLETLCISKATAVVTVSEGVADLYQQEFGQRPIVVRNCHDSRIDAPPEFNLRDLLGLSKEHFLLVTVGQAKKGMAIQEALDALLLLPDQVHLAFVGRNYDSSLEDIQGRDLADRVHVVPPVLPNEVVPFIRTADAALILYFPWSVNYENALPNRFFQSVAAELPLLYPDLSEIRALAEKHQLGLPVDPQSPESISSAVMRLKDDAKLMLALKENAVRTSKILSWEQEEKILHDLLSQTLEAEQRS